MKMNVRILMVILASWVTSASAESELTYGPYSVESLVRVKDADTLVVSLHIYPGQTATDTLRVMGIDAPETRRGYKDGQAIPECEIQLGKQLKEKVTTLLSSGSLVVDEVQPDRDSFGRLVGKISVDGQDLGELLINTGLVRRHSSGDTRTIWECSQQ